MFRIGYAKDIHRLIYGKKLILGGIEITTSKKGEDAYSDGDVVLHAISEAMLGALALGDLGTYFPNNCKKYHNIASKNIIDLIYKKIIKLGYNINNIDVSIELEKPKIISFILKIRKNISKILKINMEQISVKVNTNENMDSVGKNKAVTATAILLLNKNK